MKKISRHLLIVDDDRFLCRTIVEGLMDLDIGVHSAHSVAEGLDFCRRHPVDLILLDQKLPDANGIDACTTLLERHERLKIIFITAYPSFENAVQAIKNGAHDYLSKPFEIGELRLAVTNTLRTIELEQMEQIQRYRNRMERHESTLIGAQAGLREVQRLVALAAGNRAPVLITGETGTGKSLVAKAIHYSAPENGASFLSINCAALPENLMEAELFGYEKGAFTGAATAAKGIFELAGEGTLFLDEIGEIPLHLQSKLLGVLDEHVFRRLGGQQFKPVHARIIAATNVDLAAAIQTRRFRQDLYFRLGVVPIHVPALRHRLEDLPELCRYFIERIAPDQRISMTSEELLRLASYDWPGNVRELRNIIERAIILRNGPKVQPSRLLLPPGQATAGPLPAESANVKAAIRTLADMEKAHITATLAHFKGNHTRTARALGISRSTLLRKLQEHRWNQAVSKSGTVS